MKKKRISFVTVVLCGVAAVTWSIRAVLDIVYGTVEASIVFFIFNILCIAIWIIAFFVNLHRYRSNDKEK